MLECKKCDRWLPETEFHRSKNEPRGYGYPCKSCKSEAERFRRESDPGMVARKRENLRRWRLKNKQRSAYIDQKNNAQKRGIDFLFSFDEWVEWWGDDFDKRGSRWDWLVMARHGDSGPYSPDNCYKATGSQNGSDQHRFQAAR